MRNNTGASSNFDPSRWTMRESAHYNGGAAWFGYGHQCIQQPRLYRLDRYSRKDRSVTSTWSVDGEDCADLTEAIGRLKTDPIVTPDEIAALALLSPEPVAFRELRASDAYKALPPGLFSHWLSRKGLAWAENGTVRRTELGERLLRAATPNTRGSHG